MKPNETKKKYNITQTYRQKCLACPDYFCLKKKLLSLVCSRVSFSFFIFFSLFSFGSCNFFVFFFSEDNLKLKIENPISYETSSES